MAYDAKKFESDEDGMPSFDNKKLHQWLLARQIDRTLRSLPESFIKSFDSNQGKNNILAAKMAMDGLNFLIQPIGKPEYKLDVVEIQKDLEAAEGQILKGRMSRYRYYNKFLYPWLMKMSDQLEPAGLVSPKLVYMRFKGAPKGTPIAPRMEIYAKARVGKRKPSV